MTKQAKHSDWIESAKERGWADVLGIFFDVIEPIAPIAAQLLWVTQPIAGVFGASSTIEDIANALEEPDRLNDIRRRLEEDTQE